MASNGLIPEADTVLRYKNTQPRGTFPGSYKKECAYMKIGFLETYEVIAFLNHKNLSVFAASL